jgi:hypothetical protein
MILTFRSGGYGIGEYGRERGDVPDNRRGALTFDVSERTPPLIWHRNLVSPIQRPPIDLQKKAPLFARGASV